MQIYTYINTLYIIYIYLCISIMEYLGYLNVSFEKRIINIITHIFNKRTCGKIQILAKPNES